MVVPVDWRDVHTQVPTEVLPEVYYAIGSVVFAHSLLDIEMAKVVASITGIGDRLASHHLTANIDAVTKTKIVRGISSTFKSNPHGVIEDFVPRPELAARMDRLCALFETVTATRNTLAHGAVAYHGEKLVVGSIQASSMMKASGSTDKWVYLDTVDQVHANIREALDLAKAIRVDFDEAYAAVRETDGKA